MSSYCDVAPGDPWHGPYHDAEYGFPLTGDAELFERLVLEINQAGLSWLTILRKRENFRAAFQRFDIDRVAEFGEADIVLSDWSSALRVGPAEVERAERLVFVMSAAVGLDSLDLPILTGAGVVVANTAGLNAPSVAEWCLGAAFAVARSLAWVDREVRAGGWPQLELPERGSTELAGRRVGVVGLGAVGSRVAALFGGIGCEVRYWTRHPRPAADTAGATWTTPSGACRPSRPPARTCSTRRGCTASKRYAPSPRRCPGPSTW